MRSWGNPIANFKALTAETRCIAESPQSLASANSMGDRQSQATHHTSTRTCTHKHTSENLEPHPKPRLLSKDFRLQPGLDWKFFLRLSVPDGPRHARKQYALRKSRLLSINVCPILCRNPCPRECKTPATYALLQCLCFSSSSRESGKSKWGRSDGGLRPLPAIRAQSSTILWPFWAPF